MTCATRSEQEVINDMLPPLQFIPLIKRARWGGTRLATVLGKNIGQAVDAAESWELVDHGTDQSEVVAGEFQGWTLSRLVAERRAELIGKTSTQTTFPLLVKYLDALDRLSLQVHPNDEQAQRYVPGSRGKSEAWMILQASPGSQIYAGLKSGVQAGDLRNALSEGKVLECVHSFEARVGDCVHIPAGTVHAIGEGVLLVEIQQTSDITFRLHDWGRLGADGQPRPLHIQQSLECVNYAQGPVQPVAPERTVIDGNQIDLLIQSPYFEIRRVCGRHPWTIKKPDQYQVLNILNGAATITSPFGQTRLNIGASVLVPASCPDWEIQPQGECEVMVSCQ